MKPKPPIPETMNIGGLMICADHGATSPSLDLEMLERVDQRQVTQGGNINLNPGEGMKLVFNLLGAAIADYGVYLYLVLVWVSVVVLAWIFSGDCVGHFRTSYTFAPASAL